MIDVTGETAQQIVAYAEQHQIEAEAKDRKNALKDLLLPWATKFWLNRYAESKKRPPLLKFKGTLDQTDEDWQASGAPDFAQLTFVLTDNGGKYELDPQSKIIMESAAKAKALVLTEEVTTTYIDQAIMAKPEVAAAMQRLVKRLVKQGVITAEESAKMFVQSKKVTVKKGILDLLGNLCDHSFARMDEMFKSLKSNVGTSFRV